MIPERMSSDIAEELEVSEMAILLIITDSFLIKINLRWNGPYNSLLRLYIYTGYLRGVSDTSKWW